MPKGKSKRSNTPVNMVVTIRLLCGPFLFITPLITTIIMFFLDWTDGEIFKRAKYSHEKYNQIDKILDYYWYLSILLFIYINNIFGKELFFLLFFYRTIGQILFLMTKNRKYLFIFPNLFEILFYFYLLTTIFSKLTPFLVYPNVLYILLFIIPGVLIREYILHIKQSNLSWFFTGKTTYWIDEKK